MQLSKRGNASAGKALVKPKVTGLIPGFPHILRIVRVIIAGCLMKQPNGHVRRVSGVNE